MVRVIIIQFVIELSLGYDTIEYKALKEITGQTDLCFKNVQGPKNDFSPAIEVLQQYEQTAKKYTIHQASYFYFF